MPGGAERSGSRASSVAQAGAASGARSSGGSRRGSRVALQMVCNDSCPFYFLWTRSRRKPTSRASLPCHPPTIPTAIGPSSLGPAAPPPVAVRAAAPPPAPPGSSAGTPAGPPRPHRPSSSSDPPSSAPQSAHRHHGPLSRAHVRGSQRPAAYRRRAQPAQRRAAPARSGPERHRFRCCPPHGCAGGSPLSCIAFAPLEIPQWTHAAVVSMMIADGGRWR